MGHPYTTQTRETHTMRALMIYVTGILALWRVVDSWEGWECLCGHSVCEWCDGWDNGVWSDEDMITRYDIPRNSLVSDM